MGKCGTVRDFALRHLKGHIKFQEQYKIKDFSAYAAFDFALFDTEDNLLGLIEFDGEQHYIWWRRKILYLATKRQ